jgi:hypothetical protein
MAVDSWLATDDWEMQVNDKKFNKMMKDHFIEIVFGRSNDTI